MSASCQSIDSMFEVRPIGTRTKFKPVKKPASEIPSVELVTELVEVQLEELRFYVMVSVQYAPLDVADDNVYPWQDFPDTPFVVRNDGMMGGCHPVLFKGDIAAEPVRGHIGIPVRTLLNLARNGGSLEIVDDLHLYMPDTLGRTVLLGRRRLWQAAFRHDKDRGLALASPSALQWAIFLFFRRFRGEEALVNLHVTMKRVASVALAHHVAQLMHHLPYGLVTLAANLALYLLGGYGTLCRRQKEHGSKPVTNRQMATLHHRTGTKLHLMFAIHARPGLVARIPAQAQTAALTTVQAVMLTETTKGFLTGYLVGILTVKIKQVHNAYVYCLTFYILHKVFQNMPVGQFGSLNFAILVTCGHSFYIILGIDSSQIKEICLKDIKDTLLLRCVRGLLRRLGLYWFFRSLYIRSESLEQLSLIEENARIIIIDNRHLVDLRIIDKILPSSVERNLFYWTPICQLFHRYTSEKRSKYMKAISKMYRISSFNADDARIYPEIAVKPPFFRFPNKSKLTSDVTQGLYFIGYEKNRRDVLLEYKALFERLGLPCSFLIFKRKMKGISYFENIQNVSRCSCVVDITTEQTGISLRPLEALFFDKKLITNNKSIKEYSFYHPNNIFILEEDDLRKLPEFVTTPVTAVSEKVKEEFDINSWILNY